MENKELFIVGTERLLPWVQQMWFRVSGGTIAFITGIYEELIDSIAHRPPSFKIVAQPEVCRLLEKDQRVIPTRSGRWYRHLYLLSGQLMTWLLNIIPSISGRFSRFDRRFVGTGSQRNQTLAYRYGDLTDCRRLYRLCHYRDVAETPNTWWFIILSGAIAICAMILPGISGAFILLLMGKYSYILGAVSSLNIGVMLLFIVGALPASSVFPICYPGFKNIIQRLSRT